MGTHKTDTQTGQFDPGSMQAFKGITGALGGTLPGFIQNPFQSPQFGLEQQMGTQQAQNLGGTGMSNLLRNMTASGMAGGASSPAGLEMQQNQGRANTGLQAQLGFMNPTMNALQRQQFAMGLGSQYRPLQTGQTNVESTGGLGTWLPQLANMGLGMASGGMFGNLFGRGGGGMPQSPFGSQGNIGNSGVPFAGAQGGFNWGGQGPSFGSPMSGWGAPTPPPPPQ